MLDGEKLFLNMLVLFCAGAYWLATGHYVPALLGLFIVILYFVDTSFAFLDLVLALGTLLLIIIFFFIDYFYYEQSSDFAQFSFSILYMGVIFLKSRSIFYAE
ncbi:MAG: hypothetical protein FAF04_07415 [Epsilonproteobacteria bacterium]|nr:hypothetical protein [Campylobacterota bacterium]